jgi:hypothetical protein
VRGGRTTIEAEIRGRVRGMIEAIVEEKLESTLGASRSERGRCRAHWLPPRCARQRAASLRITTDETETIAIGD